MIVFRYLLVLWFALAVPVSAAATAHEHRCDPPAHEMPATAKHTEHAQVQHNTAMPARPTQARTIAAAIQRRARPSTARAPATR
jgi:hypothetical protein